MDSNLEANCREWCRSHYWQLQERRGWRYSFHESVMVRYYEEANLDPSLLEPLVEFLKGDGWQDCFTVHNKPMDMAGWKTRDVWYETRDGDTKAPTIRPTLDNAPSFVLDDEPGESPIAFFDKPTVLYLRLDDASGIRSIELVNADDAAVRHELKNVSDDRRHAQIELAAGPLSNDVEVVVCDMANNVARWSLRSRGSRVVANVEAYEENEPLTLDP